MALPLSWIKQQSILPLETPILCVSLSISSSVANHTIMKNQMKKYVAILLCSPIMGLLSACDTQQTMKHTVDLKQVKGLEDCTYYVVDPGGTSPIMRVIRCPNSTTGTSYNRARYEPTRSLSTAWNTFVVTIDSQLKSS